MPDWLMAWLGQFQGGSCAPLPPSCGPAALRLPGWRSRSAPCTHSRLDTARPRLPPIFSGARPMPERDAHRAFGSAACMSCPDWHSSSFCGSSSVCPSMTGRSSPAFTLVGYGLIILSGAIMIAQSLRTDHGTADGAHALTAEIGLLPCPLTISVLGFAWTQSSAVMVGVVLVSLALGISLTIGLVALLAILARRGLGAAVGSYLPGLERWSRALQGVAGASIVAIGLLTIAAASM